METKVEEQPTIVDTAKIALAVVIVLAGLVVYYYFGNVPTFVRALGILVALGLAAVVALTSLQGRTLWKFVQGARVELSKVVWPTKDETIQTTLVVLIVAVIGGVIFWTLDFFLLWITTRITGTGSL
jgi:preprotein translocase subunit SecE